MTVRNVWLEVFRVKLFTAGVFGLEGMGWGVGKGVVRGVKEGNRMCNTFLAE